MAGMASLHIYRYGVMEARVLQKGSGEEMVEVMGCENHSTLQMASMQKKVPHDLVNTWRSCTLIIHNPSHLHSHRYFNLDITPIFTLN